MNKRDLYRSVFGVTCLTVSALWSFSALAEVNTVTESDPRKAKSARVVSDVGAANEEKGKDDSERMDKSYEPKGVEMGSFLLLPKFEVDEVFNSNVFAVHDGEQADFVTMLRPSFKLRSNFSEHALNITGQVEQQNYTRFHNDDQLNAQGEVNGRLDLAKGTDLSGLVRAMAGHEERGSPDESGGKVPAATQTYTGQSTLTHKFGKMGLEFGGDANRYIFADVETSTGTRVHNGDRDRWEYSARARGSYDMFPGYAAVGEVSANKRTYDQSLDDDGYARSSKGYRVETGVGVDISQLIRGDFLVGYFSQDYEDTRLTDPSGLSVRATFNWTPDAATIIIPALERSVQETTQTRASAMIRNSASLTVRREVQRNLILTAFGSYYMDEMEGVSSKDSWTAEGRLRATYSFNPEVFVAGELSQKHKVSETEASSFDQTKLMLRLGLQM